MNVIPNEIPEPTKRYCAYSKAEVLLITNEQLNDAIRIEAIERGIQPPIPLSEALLNSEWRGYKLPPQAIEAFELVTKEGYSSAQSSGIGYLDEARAKAALDGLVSIDHGYGNTGVKLKSCEASIQKVFIGVSAAESKAAKFESFRQDTTEFDKVRDECMTHFGNARQEAYTKKVNVEKKAEYLRLAGGNEEIARAFWTKAERTEWPTE